MSEEKKKEIKEESPKLKKQEELKVFFSYAPEVYKLFDNEFKKEIIKAGNFSVEGIKSIKRFNYSAEDSQSIKNFDKKLRSEKIREQDYYFIIVTPKYFRAIKDHTFKLFKKECKFKFFWLQTKKEYKTICRCKENNPIKQLFIVELNEAELKAELEAKKNKTELKDNTTLKDKILGFIQEINKQIKEKEDEGNIQDKNLKVRRDDRTEEIKKLKKQLENEEDKDKREEIRKEIEVLKAERKEIIQKFRDNKKDRREASTKSIGIIIENLKEREYKSKMNAAKWKWMSIASIIGSAVIVAVFCFLLSENKLDLFIAIASATLLVGLFLILARFSFNLAKSYMNEVEKLADRVHAIQFGRLFIQVYNTTVERNDFLEAFKNWNWNENSSFISMNPDIHLDGISELVKKSKN